LTIEDLYVTLQPNNAYITKCNNDMLNVLNKAC